MGAVAHYVEVNVPAAQAYRWWRGLTNLPSGWHVAGPLGRIVDWNARIVEDVPNVLIVWATGDEPAGSVRFDDHGSTTGVEVSLASEAEDVVYGALEAFKQTIEQGATPGA